MFKKLLLKQADNEPGTSLEEAIAITFQHLKPIGEPSKTNATQHTANFNLTTEGPNTKLDLDLEICSSYLKNTAIVTTFLCLTDKHDPSHCKTLGFSDLLVGDRVTCENPGPTLSAALAIAVAIKKGATKDNARRVANETFQVAKRKERFGTANTIKLHIPFAEKDQAKARYPGRLLWNKTEKTWYYIGDCLPKDLERFSAQRCAQRS